MRPPTLRWICCSMTLSSRPAWQLFLREPQRCDDTETDSRVDAASCRLLDIRSMMVLPILDGSELVGVFEVFSPRPHAIGDMEVQTLQALCRKIGQNIHQASEASDYPS